MPVSDDAKDGLSDSLRETVDEIKDGIVSITAIDVKNRGSDADAELRILRKHAQNGNEDAQQALAELRIPLESNAEATTRGGGGSFDGYMCANSAAGDEDVRTVDPDADPERVVDADPVYRDDYEPGGAGDFDSWSERPEHSVVPVNPDQLLR